MDGTSSQEYLVNAGISVGSILGPTLFLLMLLRLAHKFYGMLFCKYLTYDNQMTVHYQDVHPKAFHF